MRVLLLSEPTTPATPARLIFFSLERSAGTGILEETRATVPESVMPTHLKPSEPLGDNDTAKYSMVPAYSPSNSVAGHISPADFDFPESEFHSPLPGSSGGSREITIGTEPDTITCPEFIGEYRVIGLIGRGGMGNVLRVKNPFFDFEQALKMIVTRLDSRSAREQFIMEMKTQAELEHAHIAKVHYAGIHGGKGKYRGQLYFVMSLEAGDLGEAIKKNGPCDPSEAAKIVRQLAQAIGLAHSRGKFHCDLKPKNILLGVDGTPKVTDFGLVKLLTETQKAGAAQGEPFGTPSYMPPEQAEGDLTRVDARSDVYGLGAILYELLTGGPPFKTGNRTEILYQVKNVDPQPIRKTQPRAPARLEAICLKCLEKDPAKRYQSAAELEKVLEEYLRPHWWVRHGKKAAVAGVMGALVAAIVWLWHTHYYTPHQEDKSEIAGAMGLNSRAESESSIPEKKLLYVEALDKFKKHAHQEHLYPDIRKDIVRIESRLGLIGAALMEKSAEESRRYGKRDTAIGQFKIAIQNYRVCLNEQSEDAGN